MLRTSIDLMKENIFTLAKARCRSSPAEMITDEDNADDIARLANTPALAESRQQSLEQATGGIDLRVNADKTEFMRFNKKKLHLNTERKISETSGQIQRPRKQHLIYQI